MKYFSTRIMSKYHINFICLLEYKEIEKRRYRIIVLHNLSFILIHLPHIHNNWLMHWLFNYSNLSCLFMILDCIVAQLWRINVLSWFKCFKFFEWYLILFPCFQKWKHVISPIDLWLFIIYSSVIAVHNWNYLGNYALNCEQLAYKVQIINHPANL